jgi:hypothetical protein
VKRPEIGDGQVASVSAYLKIVSAEGVSVEEDAANARLIAAAPEMLKALKEALIEVCPCDRDYVDERGEYVCHCTGGTVRVIRQAIAKARKG